ncbi:hypothetical protein [Bacillus sp. CECT 9360]|uniref:hypothetical protein n=1 Tax=Bacillus sp. CECT 9360 TaxID=2845821 RepID=UPI001E5A8EC6|nr:hypothetical protein [Bacillus sp. CECT 9360]CAH0345481.1 hypothetical protein BCI9360_01767 [Bacillus sp. CECT 9360]
MTERSTHSTKELEKQILEFLQAELDSISGHYHELIPSQLLPEDKLGWIFRAKKAGLFSGGMNQYYMTPAGNNRKGDLSFLSESFDSRDEKLKRLIDYVLDTELQNIPLHIQELIPLHSTVEEKLAWIRKVKEKGALSFGMAKTPNMPQNKGLGTAPFTGPGTAPGTGPGTAPWLEIQNTDMYMNMPSGATNVQKISIVKVDNDEDADMEEDAEQFDSELSRLNEVLILQSKNKREPEKHEENHTETIRENDAEKNLENHAETIQEDDAEKNLENHAETIQEDDAEENLGNYPEAQ